MPVITLPDGSQGYAYPRKPQPYKPTETPYVGAVVQPKFSNRPPDMIIREAAAYGKRPTAKDPGGTYWVAPIAPDGTIGTMTTRFVFASELLSADLPR